jgi:UDP-N-acetylmuramoyl-tripeptide--D-alanyl-D-alanine ligase
MKNFFSLYSPNYSRTLVYMLQSTEYAVEPYLKWVWRTKDFSSVMRRRTLNKTKAARLLLLSLRLGILLELALGCLLVYLGLKHHLSGGAYFGVALIIVYPFIWAYLLIVPLTLGRLFITGPAQAKQIEDASIIFADHKAIKIAVAGSYGKTSMKELLNTVLSEKFKLAVTPANKNVSSSHAKFAKSLQGDEEILVIEYGEGEPGDVMRFANLTHPTQGVITGLAPAHLDKYKTLQAAGQDIFSLADYLQNKNVYVNDEAESVKPFIKDSYNLFNEKSALDWQVSQVRTGLDGTSFEITKHNKKLSLKSGLVGKHQVGYLAFVAAYGLNLGMTDKQVVEGLSKTKPFEHRLQPYSLSGAWIIDDTYNGNLEGIKAGTRLLRDLQAKRKIYVTPGLVDQGEENRRVHISIGKLIAEAAPNIVVLMKNSTTKFIEAGLMQADYGGEIRIEDDPLGFYLNLKHFVASGDLVVMQNDWPDNYA